AGCVSQVGGVPAGGGGERRFEGDLARAGAPLGQGRQRHPPVRSRLGALGRGVLHLDQLFRLGDRGGGGGRAPPPCGPARRRRARGGGGGGGGRLGIGGERLGHLGDRGRAQQAERGALQELPAGAGHGVSSGVRARILRHRRGQGEEGGGGWPSRWPSVSVVR